MRAPRSLPGWRLISPTRGSLALLLLTASALGAQTADLGVDIHKIEVGEFPQMRVSVSLVDRTGRTLKGLEARNFRVFEADKRVKIEDVAIDRTPIVAAVCVDASGSMTPAIESVKRAAGLFIRLLDDHDQAEIISFADDPRIVSPRTSDKAVLLGRLHTLAAYGATALYDALWRALQDLEGAPGRRVVLLLTDGQDQNRDGTAQISRHSLKGVLSKARAASIPIYTIGLGRKVLREELTKVASLTGARAYFAPKPTDLEDIYVQIAAQIKSQVRIEYRSPNDVRDGAWRSVEVRASADERQGSGRETFRAPGKYVLELDGQGFDRLRTAELASELPGVRLYDFAIRKLLEGKPSDLLGWLLKYYQREAPPPPPAKP